MMKIDHVTTLAFDIFGTVLDLTGSITPSVVFPHLLGSSDRGHRTPRNVITDSTSYGNVFRRVYAGSPGVMQPIAVNGKPPIFISHGRSDPTMPIDETSRKFVPKLKALGYEVTYREYDGRHQLPPEMLREAITWLASSAR